MVSRARTRYARLAAASALPLGLLALPAASLAQDAGIASVVQALANDVQGILAQYGTNALTLSAGKSDALGGNSIHFGTHDRQRLVALQAKAAGILADSQVRMQMLKK